MAENKKTVEGMYEAFGRGDIPFVIGALDRDVEWWEAENFIYDDKNPYIGPQAVLEGVFARIGQEWEWFTVTPIEVLDAGESVVGRGHYAGKYRQTGREVKAQFAHVFSFRNGKVVGFQQYTDTAQFQKAVTG
jgi:ketosteroid isomerase-like protein